MENIDVSKKTVYVVDLMALIQVVTGIPETMGELSFKLV